MSNSKDDNEWSFKLDTAHSDLAEKEKKLAAQKSVVDKAKEERSKKEREVKKKLVLEDAPKESLTRKQMAERLDEQDSVLEKDVVHYAHPIKRFLATLVDFFVLFVVIYVGRLLILPCFLVIHSFITHYKIDFVLNQNNFLEYGDYTLIFLSYFFVFVVSTAFYNRTIGKKFLGLMVREDERFSLSVSDMFVREMLLKPISMISIIGGAMAFFHEKRKCLHDLFLKTIVIDD